MLTDNKIVLQQNNNEELICSHIYNISLEFFNLPFYVGNEIISKNNSIDNLFYQTSLCFRLFFSELYNNQENCNFFTIGCTYKNNFNYNGNKIINTNCLDGTNIRPMYVINKYHYYLDFGTNTSYITKFILNNYIEISLYHRCFFGMFIYNLDKPNCFMNFGGEYAWYIDIINDKRRDVLNIGIMLKYWYNFLHFITHEIFSTTEFCIPWLNYPKKTEFSLTKVFNSYTGMPGISYYTILIINLNIFQFKSY